MFPRIPTFVSSSSEIAQYFSACKNTILSWVIQFAKFEPQISACTFNFFVANNKNVVPEQKSNDHKCLLHFSEPQLYHRNQFSISKTNWLINPILKGTNIVAVCFNAFFYIFYIVLRNFLFFYFCKINFWIQDNKMVIEYCREAWRPSVCNPSNSSIAITLKRRCLEPRLTGLTRLDNVGHWPSHTNNRVRCKKPQCKWKSKFMP